MKPPKAMEGLDFLVSIIGGLVVSGLMKSRSVLTFACLALTMLPCPLHAEEGVGPVPVAVRERLGLSAFYRKHVDADGFSIVSSGKVSDFALLEARWIVDHMLVGRDDVRKALAALGFRLGVMATDEFTTDLPEHSELKPKDWWDRRARGLGATRERPCVSCGEENLLKYEGESTRLTRVLAGGVLRGKIPPPRKCF